MEQLDLFGGSKEIKQQADESQQIDMFSARDVAQFGVKANPQAALNDTLPLTLASERDQVFSQPDESGDENGRLF